MPGFGKVVGIFETFVLDGMDNDDTPDVQMLQGTITFTPDVDRIIDSSTSPARVIGSSPITAPLLNGVLVNPTTNIAGIRLVSTEDPNLNPTHTNYVVTYKLTDAQTRKINIPSHTIKVPTYNGPGDEVDLAVYVPPSNTPPVGVDVANAAANRAALALTLAVRKVNGQSPDADGNIQVQASGGTAQEYAFENSAQWSISHTLGRRPVVMIYLDDGEEIETAVFADETTVTATFPTPISGTAVLI